MIYVSFMELLLLSFDSLGGLYGDTYGKLIGVTAFIAGLLIMLFIDQLFDHHSIADFISRSSNKEESLLIRTGVFSAIALAIHNFPEGFAVSMPLRRQAVGATLAIAIAIHNIPEGLAVGVAFGALKVNQKHFGFLLHQVLLNHWEL